MKCRGIFWGLCRKAQLPLCPIFRRIRDVINNYYIGSKTYREMIADFIAWSYNKTVTAVPEV